jgi:hypothetical protein
MRDIAHVREIEAMRQIVETRPLVASALKWTCITPW